jgi:hypothetical protein
MTGLAVNAINRLCPAELRSAVRRARDSSGWLTSSVVGPPLPRRAVTRSSILTAQLTAANAQANFAHVHVQVHPIERLALIFKSG